MSLVEVCEVINSLLFIIRLDGASNTGLQHDGSQSSFAHLYVRQNTLLSVFIFARLEPVPQLSAKRRL